MNFPNPPSSKDIAGFVDHLLRTGRPDEWNGLTKTHPGETENFEIVHRFDVPRQFRGGKVPMATCPICSPDAPKFYDGILVYYPDEACVRAVGTDCAKRHYGDEVVKRKLDEFARREQIQDAETFLARTINQLPALALRAEQLELSGRDADGLRAALTVNDLKRVWLRIEGQLYGGVLRTFETVTVPSVDRSGVLTERREEREAERFPVSGLAFISGTASIGDIAGTARAAIAEAAVEHSGGEAAIDRRRLIESAISRLEEAASQIELARQFVLSTNLDQLQRWTELAGGASQIELRHDRHGDPSIEIRLKMPGRAWISVPIPKRLRPQ